MSARLDQATREETLARVREALSGSDLGTVTLQEVAQDMGFHPNTVINHLEACDTSWKREKHVERMRRLDALLQRPGRTRTSQLTAELGYQEVSSFSRFFKQAKNQTYTEWRLRRQTA